MPKNSLEHLTIAELRRLSSVVADSSSLIILQRAGYLSHVSEAVTLHCPPGVIRELSAGKTAISSGINPIDGDEDLYEGYAVDAQVVVAARQMRLPALSDDLTLLGRAAEHGVPGYTARSMLELLLLRGAISMDNYRRFKRTLSSLVRYAVPLYIAAEELHWEIRKEIG